MLPYNKKKTLTHMLWHQQVVYLCSYSVNKEDAVAEQKNPMISLYSSMHICGGRYLHL